jgi:hypothetical protein
VKFRIYHNEDGHIEYGPKGVILRRFKIFPSIFISQKSGIFALCTIGCGFEINLDAMLITVHLVVKQDNLGTLMNISNTNQWKAYIT